MRKASPFFAVVWFYHQTQSDNRVIESFDLQRMRSIRDAKEKGEGSFNNPSPTMLNESVELSITHCTQLYRDPIFSTNVFH
jgi:hypothetical protein